MAYCKKCGKELKSSEAYCPKCGTKVDSITLQDITSSVKRGAGQVADIAKQLNLDTGFGNKLQKNYNSLGVAKTWFWVSLGAIVLNFCLMFAEMINVEILFFSKSMNFFEAFNTLKEYGEDVSPFDKFFYVGIVLMCISVLTIVIPLFLSERYKLRMKALLYIPLAYNAILYIIAIIVISSAYSDGEVSVNFPIYLYIAETLLSFVPIDNLSKNLKRIDKEEKEKKENADSTEKIKEG